MARYLGTLSLIVGTWAVLPPAGHPNWGDADPTEEVPALFVDGVDAPVWVAPFGTYWDQWDGGGSIRDAIADALRDKLWPEHREPIYSKATSEVHVPGVGTVKLTGDQVIAVAEATEAAKRGECAEHGVKWPCFTCVKALEEIR